MAMASLWFADRIDQPLPPNPVDVDRSADVAVVGAGLTGLIRTSAARAGDRVISLRLSSFRLRRKEPAHRGRADDANDDQPDRDSIGHGV